MTWPLVKPTAGYMTLSRLVSRIFWPSTSTSVAVLGGTRWRLLLGGLTSVARASLDRLIGPLAHHRVRVLVVAQALEGRLAHCPALGPLAELHLGDQRGVDVRSALRRLAPVER